MEILEKENKKINKISSTIDDDYTFLKLEILKNFSSKNFKLGKLLNKKNYKNSCPFEKNFIFKVNFNEKEEKLQILISDFSNIFISSQNKEQILELNNKLNPAIESENLNSFVKFLDEKLFNFDKNSIIFQEEYQNLKNEIYTKFTFESSVDIIKVKWELECKLLNKVRVIKLNIRNVQIISIKLFL